MTTVALASSEVRQAKYDSEESCTSDGAQSVVKKRSKIHCAAACNEHVYYMEYSFDETTKDCSLYKHKALFYEAKPDCSGYKVANPILTVSLSVTS